MSNNLIGRISSCVRGGVRLFAVITLCASAAEYEINVNAIDGDKNFSALAADIKNGLNGGARKNDTLIKTGDGRLIMDENISSFVGPVIVRGGYLRAPLRYSLGKEGTYSSHAEPVTVESGATLEIGGGETDNLHFTYRDLYFGGTGVNGDGAIVCLNSQYNAFERGAKIMTSDARITGLGRFDIRFGVLDMNGFDLVASNRFAITQCTVQHTGNITLLDGCLLNLESGPIFEGDASNVIYAKPGCKIAFKKCANPIPWKLNVEGLVRVDIYADTVSESNDNGASLELGLNQWSGPVNIAAGGTLWLAPGSANGTTGVTLAGKISGAGGITVANGNVHLCSAENDFTGLLAVTGTVYAYSLGSIPSLESSRFDMARYYPVTWVLPESDPFEDAEARILSIYQYNQTAKTPLKIRGSYALTHDVDTLTKIAHEGEGTATLSGGFAAPNGVLNKSGTLALTGAEGEEGSLGSIDIRGGTVVLTNSGYIYTGFSQHFVGAAGPDIAKLVVGTNTALCAATYEQGNKSKSAGELSYLKIGCGPSGTLENGRGIMEILDGALISNRFDLSAEYGVPTQSGAMYLRGGELICDYWNQSGNANVGGKGSGYLELTGGKMLLSGANGQWFHIGNRGTQGGVVAVKGGLLQHINTGFTIGYTGSKGELFQSGGTIAISNTVTFCCTLWGTTSVTGAVAILNQVGGTNYTSATYKLGNCSNSVSMVNLAGGVFGVGNVIATTNMSQELNTFNWNFKDNLAYVNFNGGTVKRYWQQMFKGPFTRFTVFEGGATFDSNAQTMEFNYPLMAPEGKGVASIATPPNEPWDYIGSPFVSIIDPTSSGYGAAAHADFDSVSGLLTGIRIVSPGCNYGPGTYAKLSYMGNTNEFVITDVTLTDSVSGGLTKKNTGTLLFKVAGSTYSGPTCVDEGTLNVTTASYPANSPLGSGAGTLKIDGDGTVTIPGLMPDVAKLKAAGGACTKVTGSIAFADGATISVLNADMLNRDTDRLPLVEVSGSISGSYVLTGIDEPGWQVMPSGNKLVLVYPRGTTIIVR